MDRGQRAHWTVRHVEQVEQSLADHVYPVIGDKPVESVEPAAILDLLGGMLADGKVETARRVRQRLDAVFEYAWLRHKLPSNPVVVAKREISKRVKAARKANPEKNFSVCASGGGAAIATRYAVLRWHADDAHAGVVRRTDRVPDRRGAICDVGRDSRSTVTIRNG